jgi:hypothetical protein
MITNKPAFAVAARSMPVRGKVGPLRAVLMGLALSPELSSLLALPPL